MKKSLIALAVLAASGASFAQSSVTLYGIADVWFGSVKAGGVTNTVVESGGVAGSRFGFKGSEDLGGGLKANFLLEQGFNMDTGAAGTSSLQGTNGKSAATAAGQAFARQSYVGLSGGFGEVKLGKTWTAYDDIAGGTQTVFDSALSPIGIWASQTYTSNPANAVYYVSPKMGGFSVAVDYALGENKTVATATTNGDPSSVAAINVQYAGGPVSVGMAYQTEKPVNGGASTDFGTLRGSYDFGAAKLIAGVGRKNGHIALGDQQSTDWLIGVDVPVAPALTLSAGYARSNDNDVAGVAGDTRKSLGLAAAYSMSKRTTLYAGVNAQNTDKGVDDNLDHNVRIYALGVNHAF
jgi:predicted porin